MRERYGKLRQCVQNALRCKNSFGGMREKSVFCLHIMFHIGVPIEMIRRDVCPDAVVEPKIFQIVEEKRRQLCDNNVFLVGKSLIDNMIQRCCD